MTDQRIRPYPCTAHRVGAGKGWSPVGFQAKIRTLTARAQYSALLGLEPLFTTNNFLGHCFVET